jgi:methionine synthase II (cobalamin-independent)
MPGSFCVSITHSQDNTDKATVGFVVANAAVASDKDTMVFLSIEGVRLSQKGFADTIHEPGFAPLKELNGLIPYLNRMRLDQFVLEYATSRAGTPKALAGLRPDAQIGYGVVNPRTSEIESADEIVRRVRELAQFVSPDRIFLSPDCGFGTFAERPVADAQTAFKKLSSLAAAARILRKP